MIQTFADREPRAFRVLSAVAAYRADLERIGEREHLKDGLTDIRWLTDAVWFEHELVARVLDRESKWRRSAAAIKSRFRARTPRGEILEGATALEVGVREVLQRAEEMEKRGGLLLAASLISHARVAWIRYAPRGASLALVHLGRIARTLGSHAEAQDCYQRAERDGKALRYPVVTGRAMVGQGALLHEIGRLADAESKYRSAIRAAGAVNAVAAMANLGLSSVAHRTGRIGEAVDYAVKVLEDVHTDPARRAEVLVNLASAMLAAGYTRHALRAAKLATTVRSERTQPIAIGAMALAAARVGQVRRVEECVRSARRITALGGLPYPVALMWLLVSRALLECGSKSSGRSAAARAKRVAARHGFNGLEADADGLLTTGEQRTVVSDTVIDNLSSLLGLHTPSRVSRASTSTEWSRNRVSGSVL